MRNPKYHLYLSKAEHCFIIQCLLNLRNNLILQDKCTDGVDDILIEFTK